MDVVLWVNDVNLKCFYFLWSLYSLWPFVCHNAIIPFVCYCFIDQLTENYMAWKTIQVGHATSRQAKSWFQDALLQFVSSVGVTLNLVCWYFWKFGISVGTLNSPLKLQKVAFTHTLHPHSTQCTWFTQGGRDTGRAEGIYILLN